MSGSDKYDVVIVGGGPAGLTLGVSLAHFMPELKLAVADRRGFSIPDDARSLALAAGVTRIFETLGIWEKMSEKASPISHMRVTDSATGDISRPVFLSFDGEVQPGRAFAHMVPYREIMSSLLDAARGRLDLLAPVEVTGLDTGGGQAELRFVDGKSRADGELLKASLIVAADGSRSALRDMAGIKTIDHDYRQSGLVTTIAHEIDHGDTAFEHFRSAGPFASLPLPNSRSSLVWTETSVQAARLKSLSAEEQCEIIEISMGHCLGKVTLEEPIQSFPLRLRVARNFVAPRLALIGDAAHAIHPITGQGLNLGLKDVAALAEVIIEAMRHGEDPGMLNVLERYQRWRRMDVSLMALVTDGLNRVFSNDIMTLRMARDIGLGLVDRMPIVKKTLIRHAAGMQAGSPKLLLGLDL